MPPRSTTTALAPNADERRVAAENFDRARQVIATDNFDYDISLLTLCCKLDPGNFTYRRELRRAQKEKYDNNLRGSRFAFFTTPRLKARVKAAKAQRDHLKVLNAAEAVLARNPWDMGTQMDMADAFDALGLTDLAVFSLDQARQKYPKDASLNRSLARLFEKRGDFKQAIVLWQIVAQNNPQDVEAGHKVKFLAASETIAKGGYEEAAAGTKESPIIARLEAQNSDRNDKVAREVNPLLKRLEANPTEPTLYVQLATAYKRLNQPDRARAALDQGLQPTGNHFSLRLELLELDLEPLRKKFAEADAKFKAVRADDADTAEELKAARDKLKADILSREVETLRLRAEQHPNDLGHRLELGTKLYKGGRLDEAITELQVARRDERLKGRAAMVLGACFRKRNNWRLAQRNFEEALAAIPETDEASRKEILYQLATGSAEHDDLPRAVDLGHELANLDFNYKNIGGLLEGWEAKVGKA